MDRANSAYWSVTFANGKSYQVQIEPNATGSTCVIERDVLKAAANVECFKRFDQPH